MMTSMINNPRNRRSKNNKKNGSSSASFSPAQIAELHKLINKDIIKKLEHKCYRTLFGPTAFNSVLTGADSLFLLTNITQGNENYQRNGESISLTRIRLKGTVSLTAGDLQQACIVTVLVMNCKTAPQATGGTMPWTSLLNSTTNGTYVGWTGLSTDRNLSINSGDFEVLARRDIPLDVIWETAATLSAVSEYCNVAREVDIEIPFTNGKKVHYEEGTDQPTAFNPFICITCTDMFSSAGVYAQTINAAFVSEIFYTDA